MGFEGIRTRSRTREGVGHGTSRGGMCRWVPQFLGAAAFVLCLSLGGGGEAVHVPSLLGASQDAMTMGERWGSGKEESLRNVMAMMRLKGGKMMMRDERDEEGVDDFRRMGNEEEEEEEEEEEGISNNDNDNDNDNDNARIGDGIGARMRRRHLAMLARQDASQDNGKNDFDMCTSTQEVDEEEGGGQGDIFEPDNDDEVETEGPSMFAQGEVPTEQEFQQMDRDRIEEGLNRILSRKSPSGDEMWESLIASLRLKPSDPDALLRYAHHLEKEQGEYEGAEEALKLGVLMHPSNVTFLVKLGAVVEVLHGDEPRCAEALYIRALQVDPDHAPAMLAYGTLLCEAYDDPEAAKKLLAKGKVLSPQSPDMMGTLARCLDMCGEFEDAEAAYKDALRLEPHSPTILNNYAAMLHGSGRGGEALEMYREGIEKKPDDSVIRFNYGLALEGQGEVVEAERAYRSAIAARPSDCDALAKLGWVMHTQKGESEEAKKLFKRALSVNPAHPASVVCMVRMCMGVALSAEEEGGKEEEEEEEEEEHGRGGEGEMEARDILEKASLCQPADALILREYARFHELTANMPEAEKVLRRALAISPSDCDMLTDLARALSYQALESPSLGDRLIDSIQARANKRLRSEGYTAEQILSPESEARVLFNKVLDMEPGHLDALKSYGRLLHHIVEDLEGAHKFYTKALDLDPGDFDLESELGALLFQRGKVREACARFESATANSKTNLERSEILYEYGCHLMDRGAGDGTSDMDTAAEKWSRSVDANPSNIAACYNLGMARYDSGLLNESKVLFERICSLETRNSGALYQLGRLKEDLDLDDRGAMELFYSAACADPSLSDAVCRLGRLKWRFEKDFRGAELLLRAAIEGGADEVLTSDVMEVVGNIKGAVDGEIPIKNQSHFEELRHPDRPDCLHSQAYFEYGAFLQDARQDVERAMDMYQRSLDTGGKSLALMIRYGTLCCRVKGPDAEAGMKMLEIVLQMAPSLQDVRLEYCRALLRKGWANEARKQLQPALDLNPSSPDVESMRVRVGKASKKSGRDDDEDDDDEAMEGLGDQVMRGAPPAPDGSIPFDELEEGQPLTFQSKRPRVTEGSRFDDRGETGASKGGGGAKRRDGGGENAVRGPKGPDGRELPVWARGYQSTKKAEPELVKEYSEEEGEDEDGGQGEGEDGDSADEQWANINTIDRPENRAKDYRELGIGDPGDRYDDSDEELENEWGEGG